MTTAMVEELQIIRTWKSLCEGWRKARCEKLAAVLGAPVQYKRLWRVKTTDPGPLLDNERNMVMVIWAEMAPLEREGWLKARVEYDHMKFIPESFLADEAAAVRAIESQETAIRVARRYAEA